MSQLPFGDLPAYRERTFVPAGINWEEWDGISKLFDRLEEEAATCHSTADFERWLMNWSELTAAVGEEDSRRYIAMTCHTDDEEAEAAFLRFVENIIPKMKPRIFQLSKIYLGHERRKELATERYAVMDREIELAVSLFREENVPLETEDTKLGQQYQKLAGSLTVEFQGEERTLVQMGKFLEEPDRQIRQEAWELSARRRLQEAERFDGIFDEMLKLRVQIARNAGFANYRDFAFKDRARFDYTPEDCYRFHDAIEEVVVPLVRQIQAERREKLGLESLRPWDLAVDAANRPPLRPFEEVDQLLELTQSIFDNLDPELARGFKTMRDMGLLDLANRKGKAPGGYQSSLPEARLPFIFMNSVGVQRDVETLLHESGHSFHTLATQEEELHRYRSAPIEFGEVASMSMELLGNEYLDEFYQGEELVRAKRDHLEGIIGFFPWMATVDAFQHWIYTNPEHTRQERADAFEGLMKRFGGEVDWSGYEDVRRHMWHRQLHIFLDPFYYVEYGIAQLGALQVWRNYRTDAVTGLKAYKDALALGGSRPLPELFHAARAAFSFDADAIRPVMGMVKDELAALSQS